jgi:hypothetical protein
MVFRQNRLLTTLLALGVLGAAWTLANRHAVEMRNRAVEIAVDYTEVAQLAGASGLTVPQTLARLKQAGATSVAIQERTMADVMTSGEAWVVPDREFTTIETGSSRVWGAIRRSGLTLRNHRYGPEWATVHEPVEYVLAIPVGLPEDAVEDVRSAGMPIVARLVNYPRVRKEDVERTALRLRRDGVRTVIFAADQVLGFRGAIPEVPEVFKKYGLVYGSVEFAKQKGDQRLSERMLPDVIRVHSITAAEMGTLDRPSAVERFVRAAKERNIRLAYVRMFDLADPEPLKVNMDYISAISRGLRAGGFVIRQARPFAELGELSYAHLLMGVGVAAAIWLLIGSIWLLPSLWKSIPKAAGWVLGIATGPGVVLLAGSGHPIGLKIVALLAALVFPTLAVLFAVSGAPDESTGKPLRALLARSVGRFAGAVAISFAGGLIIAGLLSRLDFMLRIEQFAGVKLAQVVPILAIALAFAAGVGWGADGWQDQRERAVANLRRLWAQPVLVWQSAVALILLVMVALLIARSGNEPGTDVSSLELRFRAILDAVLFVRPRTKELLIGHPALFLGIAAALGGRRNWAAILLVVGTVGEVSLVNTFCHIHTPVAVSVARSVIGAVLGLAIGALVLLLFSRSKRPAATSSEDES